MCCYFSYQRDAQPQPAAQLRDSGEAARSVGPGEGAAGDGAGDGGCAGAGALGFSRPLPGPGEPPAPGGPGAAGEAAGLCAEAAAGGGAPDDLRKE